MPYFLQLARNTDQLLADMGWGLGVGSVDLKLPTLMVRTPFVFGVSLPYFTHTHTHTFVLNTSARSQWMGNVQVEFSDKRWSLSVEGCFFRVQRRRSRLTRPFHSRWVHLEIYDNCLISSQPRAKLYEGFSDLRPWSYRVVG